MAKSDFSISRKVSTFPILKSTLAFWNMERNWKWEYYTSHPNDIKCVSKPWPGARHAPVT